MQSDWYKQTERPVFPKDQETHPVEYSPHLLREQHIPEQTASSVNSIEGISARRSYRYLLLALSLLYFEYKSNIENKIQNLFLSIGKIFLQS